MQLGGFFASVFIFKYGTHISNRRGLWIGCGFSIIAIILQMSSVHFAALYAGRLLLGISNGFFLTYSATYLGEIAPTILRGSAVGLVTFQTSFGALIGVLIDNYTTKYQSRTSYLIPLGVMFVVPVFLSLGLMFLPESPRHYIRLGSEEKAEDSIRILRGIKDHSQLVAEVAIIRGALMMENARSETTRLVDAFRGTDLKRTILSMCCSIGQTASGVIFFSSYSIYFYAEAGVKNEFVWVMMSLAIALTGNMGSFFVMRFIERRMLLSLCSIINAFVMFAIAGVYTRLSTGSYTAAQVLVAMGTLFTWVYGIGQGPVLWALTVELPSQRLRSKTVGLATGCNYIFAWVATYCSPYFINPTALNWGPKYCYIWGASNLILGVWAFLVIPDVKGKSLEEITGSMIGGSEEKTGNTVEASG
jgi:predicted MFS family arabinose efflux permease